MIKIPKIIKEELDSLPIPYEIKTGTRHHKIVIGGIFAGILPMGAGNSASRRAELNVRSQIRRTVKQLQVA